MCTLIKNKKNPHVFHKILYQLTILCYYKIVIAMNTFYKEETMAEKTDLSSAYRRLKSPNIKTRKRALKIIHDFKRRGKSH